MHPRSSLSLSLSLSLSVLPFYDGRLALAPTVTSKPRTLIHNTSFLVLRCPAFSCSGRCGAGCLGAWRRHIGVFTLLTRQTYAMNKRRELSSCDEHQNEKRMFGFSLVMKSFDWCCCTLLWKCGDTAGLLCWPEAARHVIRGLWFRAG